MTDGASTRPVPSASMSDDPDQREPTRSRSLPFAIAWLLILLAAWGAPSPAQDAGPTPAPAVQPGVSNPDATTESPGDALPASTPAPISAPVPALATPALADGLSAGPPSVPSTGGADDRVNDAPTTAAATLAPAPAGMAPAQLPATVARSEPPSLPFPTGLVVVLFVLLLLSAFFSSSETALFSLSRHQLKRMERNEKSTAGQRAVVSLMKDSKSALATILIGNNMVNIGTSLTVGALAGYISGGNHVVAFLVGTVAATFLLLVAGEITPKAIALEKNESWAPTAAAPLMLIRRLFAPIRWLLVDVVGSIAFKVLRLPPEGEQDRVTEEEVKALLAHYENHGVIEQDGREMIAGVFGLTDLAVEDLMTPRVEMQAYPDSIGREELVADTIKEGSASRVFIYHENIDKVVGVLHVKDLLLSPERSPLELMREPMFVPEKKKAARLLNDFRRRRQHIAVVADEWGGTAGCVTMNDVLEQIVGDMPDPGEEAARADAIKKVGHDAYEVDGGEEIDDVNERLGVELPSEEAATVSGLIINTLGDFPEVGSEVEVAGVRLRVTRMAPRRVARALLIRPDDRRDTPAPGDPDDSSATRSNGAENGGRHSASDPRNAAFSPRRRPSARAAKGIAG
jgi:putative hemolysin